MAWGQYNAEKYVHWTEERCERLRKLWVEQGLTAAQCAAILGEGLTRNAIIGKVHRLKFPKRKSPIRLNWQGPPKPRKPTPPRTPEQRAIRYERRLKPAKPKPEIAAVKTKPEVEEEFAVDLAALNAPAWEPLDTSLKIPLHALNERTCKWPLGTEAPFTFCGCQTASGSPYCPTHKKRSTGSGTIGEQTAHRVKARHLEAA